MKKLMYPLMLLFLFACSKNVVAPSPAKVVSDDFQTGKNGWEAGFADYTAGNETGFELESGIRNLPAPLDQSKTGFFIAGRNLSDDLFMYLKKQITGLEPNTSYTARFQISFASNAPSNAVGIGGAPGESVFLGIGIVTQDPKTNISDGFVEMNIDKGNQSSDGPARKVIGNIANGRSESTYVLLEKQGNFQFTTGSDGTVWAMVSTDSGFEGKTSLFYNKIYIEFVKN